MANAFLFFLCQRTTVLFLLVYVDDIILTGNSASAITSCVQKLADRFSLKDMGALSYFLGMEVISHAHGHFLSQRKYILDMLDRTGMLSSKPMVSPMPTSHVPALHEGEQLASPSDYRSVLGTLQYLSLTRPDVAFAVNKLLQFMHSPTSAHW